MLLWSSCGKSGSWRKENKLDINTIRGFFIPRALNGVGWSALATDVGTGELVESDTPPPNLELSPPNELCWSCREARVEGTPAPPN